MDKIYYVDTIYKMSSLPSSVAYTQGSPSLPPNAKSHQVVVRSSNGLTFGQNQTVVFELPNSEFLDPTSLHLRYSYEFTDPSGAQLKGTPLYTPFQRLACFAGSVQLESISEYGQTANMLVNLTHSIGEKYGSQSPYGYFNSTTTPTLADLDGRTLTVNETGSFAGPLPCVISNCEKFLPLFALPQLRIELTVDTINNMFRSDSVAVPSNMVLKNMELVYKSVSMGQEVEAMVRQIGVTHIKTQSLLNTASFLNSAVSGSIALVYNQRLASIKSAFIYIANTTSDSNQQYDSVDITQSNGSYSITIAGTQYPQTPYNTALNKQGIFMGLKSATGSIYAKDNNFSINAVEFGRLDGQATTLTEPGKFIVGIDTEVLDNQFIMSGVSSQNSSITVNIVCNTSTTDSHNIHLITSYDALLEIDFTSGMASLKL
jgi:hypothetical protein